MLIIIKTSSPFQQKTNATKSHINSSAAKESTNSHVISLDDIKSIKLRKVSKGSGEAKHKRSQEKTDFSRKPLREISNDIEKHMSLRNKNGLPLITLKDLQAVKLKRKTLENGDVAFK